jgi:hypothetical protein
MEVAVSSSLVSNAMTVDFSKFRGKSPLFGQIEESRELEFKPGSHILREDFTVQFQIVDRTPTIEARRMSSNKATTLSSTPNKQFITKPLP